MDISQGPFGWKRSQVDRWLKGVRSEHHQEKSRLELQLKQERRENERLTRQLDEIAERVARYQRMSERVDAAQRGIEAAEPFLQSAVERQVEEMREDFDQVRQELLEGIHERTGKLQAGSRSFANQLDIIQALSLAILSDQGTAVVDASQLSAPALDTPRQDTRQQPEINGETPGSAGSQGGRRSAILPFEIKEEPAAAQEEQGHSGQAESQPAASAQANGKAGWSPGRVGETAAAEAENETPGVQKGMAGFTVQVEAADRAGASIDDAGTSGAEAGASVVDASAGEGKAAGGQPGSVPASDQRERPLDQPPADGPSGEPPAAERVEEAERAGGSANTGSADEPAEVVEQPVEAGSAKDQGQASTAGDQVKAGLSARIDEQMMRLFQGKAAGQDLESGGQVIIRQGQPITPEVVDMAREAGLLTNLIIHMTWYEGEAT